MRLGSERFELARQQREPVVTRIDVLVGGEQVASTHDVDPEERITLESAPALTQDASREIVTAINTVQLSIPDGLVPEDAFSPLDPLNRTELIISTGFDIDGIAEVQPAATMVLEEIRLEDHGNGRQVYVDMFDRAKEMERSQFVWPTAVAAGANIPELINELVQYVYPKLELVSPTIGTGAAAFQIADTDNRLSIATQLAASVGHTFMFDPSGVPMLVPPPQSGAESVATFSVAGSDDNRVLSACRTLSRAGVYNGVITKGSSTRASEDGTGDVTDPIYAESWADNVLTPLTYSQAEADVRAPGAFPLIQSTQLLTEQSALNTATVAAAELLALRPELLSFSTVPHPGLELFDVVAVDVPSIKAVGRFTVGAMTRPLTGGGGWLGVGCNERRVS